MKKTILKFIGLLFFVGLFVVNIQLLGGDNNLSISLTQLKNVAFAQSENDEDCDCPWYAFGQCNKRKESILVWCTSTQVTRTYKSSTGEIIGVGLVSTTGTVQMQWGVTSSYYVETGGKTTAPYRATKVNCPTDGKSYKCTTYFPC